MLSFKNESHYLPEQHKALPNWITAWWCGIYFYPL